MEQLIENIVRVRPLFSRKRKIEDLPYSALTLQEFQSWPVGKRRAAEWQRALDVRRTAQRVIHKVVALWEVKIWSTKMIMKWCREHGYTPHDTDLYRVPGRICRLCGVWYLVDDTSSHHCENKPLTDVGILRNPTYSVPDDWVKSLQDLQKSKEVETDEDVVIVDVTTSPRLKRRPVVKKEVKEEQQPEQRIVIPQTEGAQFVTDEANKIGIHFRAVEVSERVFAPVTEEMISAAMKCFLFEVLHKSHKVAYDLQLTSRVPTEILPIHIYEAIRTAKRMDFLTNHKLGVMNEFPASQKT